MTDTNTNLVYLNQSRDEERGNNDTSAGCVSDGVTKTFGLHHHTTVCFTKPYTKRREWVQNEKQSEGNEKKAKIFFTFWRFTCIKQMRKKSVIIHDHSNRKKKKKKSGLKCFILERRQAALQFMAISQPAFKSSPGNTLATYTRWILCDKESKEKQLLPGCCSETLHIPTRPRALRSEWLQPVLR